MRVLFSRSAISLFAALLSAPAFAPLPKILDPDGPWNHVLGMVAEALDRRGIDVILGAASDFPVPDARPRVARLSGFHTTDPSGKDWGGFPWFGWTYGFEKGLVGAVLAAKRGDAPPELDREAERCRAIQVPTSDQTCSFIADWLASPVDQRVFIAFTGPDVARALAVQAALREQGYVAFTYIREEGRDVWADPALVGEFFQQASERFVIDTRAARGSAGIMFERLCVAALTPAPPPSPFMDFLTRRLGEG